MKKTTRYCLLILSIATMCYGQRAKAQFMEGKATSRESHLTGTAITPTASLTENYDSHSENSKELMHVVSLKFNEEHTSNTYFKTGFTATVVLDVETKVTLASSPVSQPSLTLVVDFDRTAGAKYHPLDYKVYSGFERVKITVSSFTITGATGWDPTAQITVRNEIRTNYYHSLSTNSTYLRPYSFTVNTTTADVHDISWTYHNANENVSQLEWAWVTDEMASYYTEAGSLNYDLVFKTNSTRVDLEYDSSNDYHYQIPLLYPDTGHLYYRTRAVLRKKNGNMILGPWEATRSFAFNGHEDSLNWQSSTSFAEQGKRKSVIQYFDGSLRNRQVVTKDNTTGNVVMGETIYDLQGRPNIQVLPTPVNNNTIQYFRDSIRFNGMSANEDPARYFDLTPTAVKCNASRALDSSIGLGRYYSAYNDWLATEAKSKFIPKSQGYSFTETRFTDDATQRVALQGGIGPDHQINSGHETKYYYGKPAQPELDALFGTEAGDASHYFKNMVQDANGQMSVSYSDMHGRTIATALAGDSTANLSGIYTNTAFYPAITDSITNRLLTPATNIIKGDKIESISTILVPVQGLYTFVYKFEPDYLEMLNCDTQKICFDCKYNLEISIRGENCGDTIPIVWKYNNLKILTDTSKICRGGMGFVPDTNLLATPITEIVIPYTLSAGSWVIRKTLSINDSAFAVRRDSALKVLLCKTQEDLYDSIYTVLLGSSGCNASPGITCDSCTAKLGGGYAAYKIKYLAAIGNPSTYDEISIHNQYITDSVECSIACGITLNPHFSTLYNYRQQMLADVTPYSGQFALDPDSVTDTRLEAKYNVLNDHYRVGMTNISTGKPYYKYPKTETGTSSYYFTEDNQRDSAAHGHDNTGTEYLVNMNPQDFGNAFQPAWANSLIWYHPEFSKLKYAETTVKACYDWQDNVLNCTSYADAVSKGFLPTPWTSDPYFTHPFGSTAEKDSMIHRTDTAIVYQNPLQTPSIWQLANAVIKCAGSPYNSNIACTLGTPKDDLAASITSTSDKNQVWENFKTLYLGYRNDMVTRYVNAHASSPLSYADMSQLQGEGKQLIFTRQTDIANQTGMGGWWTAATNGTDTTGLYTATQVDSLNTCEGQRPIWKQRLLQCDVLDTLLSHGGADSTTAANIIDAILDSMVMVCEHSFSNPQHPYGASNVNPAYMGQPQNFEGIINHVLISHGIHTTADSNYFCNPYSIDFPKPYGKGPAISVNTANTVDSCNCSRFAALKIEAASLGYTNTSFNSMNNFLDSAYNDTLSYMLWQGLQKCDSLWIDTCLSAVGAVSERIHGAHPGEDTVYTGSDSIPCLHCKLDVYYRAQYGQPTEYKAKCEINFLPNFESGVDDYFVAYIDTTMAPCDTVTCPKPIITGAQLDTTHHDEWLVVYLNQPGGCTDCTLKIYDYYTNSLLDSIPGACRSTDTLEIPGCNKYKMVLTCSNETCTNISSDTFYYHGCGGLDSCVVYHPIVLPDYVTIPHFLDCGYEKPCITCDTLDSLTARFRTLYTGYSSVPYTTTSATDKQLSQNNLWARYLNYKTGFSHNMLTWLLAYQNCDSMPMPRYAVCALDKPLNDPHDYFPKATDTCVVVKTRAQFLAQLLFNNMKDSLIANFDSLYRDKCLHPKHIEEFYVRYVPKEYHYTLYYYDQAGNLVKTLPPAAVRPNFSGTYLDNVASARDGGDSLTNRSNNVNLATEYRYNSLNQVVEQRTPDAGTSKFWYDKLGRLVVSQNAKQAIDTQYSYTQYDYLGRITQVGQKKNANTMSQSVSQDVAALNTWITQTSGGGSLREQITRTVYDVSYFDGDSILTPQYLRQKNLRNRVSYTQFIKTEPGDGVYVGIHNAATYYSYDIHGNVDTLLQDLKQAMSADVGNRFKKMIYNYDLVSGKVNTVSYQAGFTDQFYHRYSYDAENRITAVETSHDKIYWEREAIYDYYRHGPLARAVLGQNQVQGLDYAYTIQGWLKGVNSTALKNGIYDMGEDGKSGSTNSAIGRDAFGFSLNYFAGDYKPISSTAVPFAAVSNNLTTASDGMKLGMNLFNGNIRAMVTNLTQFGAPKLYGYRYDQLNRIVGMNSFTGFSNDSTTAYSNAATISDDYKERVSYDPNGNILTYLRNGATAASGQDMDKLTYQYPKNSTSGLLLNNRLRYVHDQISDAAYSEDIDKQTASSLGTVQAEQLPEQSGDNYNYDAIGNLIKDTKEGISKITWTVYGKIDSIYKGSTNIAYTYDATGNRISKVVDNGTTVHRTIYARDASGNVMSIYEAGPDSLTQAEVPMYGSSRLGVWNIGRDVSGADEAVIDSSKLRTTFTRGNKFFELANHLGNVLATISDKKIDVDPGNDGTLDYYTADVVTANDYYPFGMIMPGREFQSGSSSYRYSINGQEKDIELNKNITTAEFWEYDSRLGRRWNVDPKLKMQISPYLCFDNSPITMADNLGDSTSSTHTDKDGKVIAVYEDGDLGVYKHKGNTLETRIEVSGTHSASNTAAGGTKIGETTYWDEFLASHPDDYGIRWPQSSNGTTYKIDFENTWNIPLTQKMNAAKNMPFWEVAEQSKNGGSLSLQDQPDLNAQGRLFNGKYASTESMGNYLAGYNANQAGMPTYNGFQRIAGALELQSHGQPEIKLGKWEMIKLALGFKSYGTFPLYGELIQQYRWSRLGWDQYKMPESVNK